MVQVDIELLPKRDTFQNLSIVLAVVVILDFPFALLNIKKVSFYCSDAESSYFEWLLNIVKWYFVYFFIMVICWFLLLLIHCIKLIFFNKYTKLGQSSFLRINPIYSWPIILFSYCQIVFSNILLRTFVVLLIRVTILHISFW